MEIHPPHRRIASLKDFLREMATITAGILIALSLEGLLDWRHHRELVREARDNIVSELHANDAELATERRDLDKMTTELAELIDLVHQLEASRNHAVHSVPFIWSLAELHATSWNTAQSTGALGFMPYDEVKRYTQVYDLQRDFQTLQQRAFAASLDVEGLETLLGRDPNTLTVSDLTDAERKLGVAKANVVAMKELAAMLQRLYAQVLGNGAQTTVSAVDRNSGLPVPRRDSDATPQPSYA